MNCNKISKGRCILLVFLICSGLGFNVTAQKQVEIELIDKSFYSGPVFKSMDSTGVQVVIEGSNVLIPHDRIRNIQFIGSKKTRINRDSLIYKVEKGYYHTFGMGLSFGFSTPGLTIGLVNGYQWNSFIGSGVGVGYELMDDISTIPVYLEVKGYLKKSKVTPYYFIRPGYGFISNASGFNETTSEGGGVYWHAGLGYQFNFESASMAVNIGHLGQDAIVKYSYLDWWSGDDTHVTEKHMKRRIAIRVEITF